MTRQISALTVVFILLGCATGAVAQDVSSNWYRHPAVSPDGNTIVFAHGGDLYRVPSTGGSAVPLTLSDGWDGYPVWSRDGQWIAFASDRHGGLDVFLMPAEGGEAKRLSYHSSSDYPSDFTPDGSAVIFKSSRMNDAGSSIYPTGAMSELYSISVNGGTPKQLLTTPAEWARYDGEGKRLLYEDVKGYENALRKHHTSAVTRDLWVVDLESETHTKLSDFEGEDRQPLWAGEDAFYFLSERAGDFNVFRQALDAAATPQQLTRFTRHPVRHLSFGGGALVFSWHGEIYRMREGEEPLRVPIEIKIDRQEPAVTMESLRKGITEMAVSPDGEEIAFVARGEVFVSSVDFKTTRRITDTPEQERSISFGPDGRRLLYAGERDGSWDVYVSRLADEEEEWFFAATKIEEEAVIATGEEEYQPRFSPDGKEIAYLAERTILKVKNLDSGNTRTVLSPEYNYSYSDGDQYFSWSPDGEWFAVHFLSRGRYYAESIGLVKADGSQPPVDITNSGYWDWQPEWAMGGKAVIWSTDRFGEKNHGSWGGEGDVLAAFLTQEAYDEFRRDKEERELAEGREDKNKNKKDKNGKDDDDGDDEDEDDDTPEPVEIDFDDLEDRTVRLTLHASDLGDFALTPDGDALLYLARFEKGYDLWAHDFVEESTKLLVKLKADRATMHMQEDGKGVFVLADGSMSKIPIKRGDDGVESGKKKSIAVDPDMKVRPDEERVYMLEHVWRQVKQKFYRKDLHGVDWDWYRAQYEPKLAGVTNDRDFATILSELLGELNASHTGGRYVSEGTGSESTASLGVYFDHDYDGPGLRIAEILEKGPLSKADLGIEPGMVLSAVDGVSLDGSANLHALLAGKEGERVRLTLRDGRKEMDKVVKPIGRSPLFGLRYDRWVERNRARVEQMSDGKLGYIHVRGMNDASFRVAYAEIFGRYFDTEGIIVDTRFNGGGWLHDDLVVLLSGKRYADFAPRSQAVDDQRFYGEPGKRWWKPSVVITNEANYSDAHFFPWAYKELEVGPLVGMPVPGTATAVWWERLHTGNIVFGIPQVGMLDLDDGSYLENQQLEPDHKVAIAPEAAAAGEDPQIQRAVEVLQQMIR